MTRCGSFQQGISFILVFSITSGLATLQTQGRQLARSHPAICLNQLATCVYTVETPQATIYRSDWGCSMHMQAQCEIHQCEANLLLLGCSSNGLGLHVRPDTCQLLPLRMVHLPQLAHLQSTPQSHILTDGKSAYAPDHGSPPSCVSPAAHTSVTHPDGQQSRELSSVRHSDKQQASIQKIVRIPHNHCS